MLLEKDKKFTFPLNFMSLETSEKFKIVLSTGSYKDFSEENRKRFVRDFTDLVSLSLLENCGNLHGYVIMKYMKQKFGSNPGTSIVYPTLWELEKKGYIKSEVVEAENLKLRRVYTITPLGRLYLQTGINELKNFVKKLEKESAIKKWYKRFLKYKFD
jgi:DNA-binding PadR family transcriptional regulator